MFPVFIDDMVHLLQNEEDKKQMAANARAHYNDKFSWSQLSRKIGTGVRYSNHARTIWKHDG